MPAMTGQAVLCCLLTHGNTKEGRVADPAETGSEGLCFCIGIFQRIAGFFLSFMLFAFFSRVFLFFGLLQCPETRRFCKVRNVEITEIALGCRQREDQRPPGELCAACQFRPFVDAVIGAEKFGGDRFLGEAFDDQSVDDIHHATNGLTAIGQRR